MRQTEGLDALKYSHLGNANIDKGNFLLLSKLGRSQVSALPGILVVYVNLAMKLLLLERDAIELKVRSNRSGLHTGLVKGPGSTK